MMTRHAFVIGQGRHRPFRHFVHVAQVGVENAGTRPIHRRPVVVGARRGCFLEGRHAPDFADGAWRDEKQLRAASGGVVDQALVIGQRGFAAGLIVRVKEARIFP